ncbi:MAG: asparagine synthase (glutamine-hydrolyzing) [Desulfobacterales bacterium]|nr:asparagine synthase (glutamine-hydrolyzing) [Desulfobacterales bacterium]MBF0398333.1 asparagine synthase (glutamine-hydrolyzing) [Desulfobacterales bacterium]
MCGICGFAGYGNISDLKNMNETMFHRGPDGEGYLYDSNSKVYMGHRRLSIIDISGGTQPMKTLDGRIAISFNGEIYNHMELRAELKRKHNFCTDHSDTEVLLHGYTEWGEDLPHKLNGMWAFAIYDKKEKILFLSRDRFGEKPLFYTLQNGTFAFASELSALIKHSNINSNLSQLSLKKYFAYGYIPSPNSLYKRIYKLPAGHNLIFNLTSFDFKIRKYWDFILQPSDNIPKNPEEKWGEELRYLLDKSVKRRLMSDVPLGVFLSGGIDSSAVAFFANKNIDNQKLKVFSIGFYEDSFDESYYAKKMARSLNTEHYLKICSIEKGKELLPQIISKLDEPIGDSSIIPTYLLCKETRKYVTVALSGDGGDELFAGYDPFRALKIAQIYEKIIPKNIHKAIRLLFSILPVSHANMSIDFKIKRTLRGISYAKKFWNPIWLGPLEPKELSELFLEKINIEEVYSEAIEYWDNCYSKELIDKTLTFYTKLYLQDDILVKTDRASMMNSLEVRAPFLDIELVDFIRKIPFSYKYHNGQTKYILKKGLEPILPNDIIYRSKKGFGIPIGKWFMEKKLNLGIIKNTNIFVKKKIKEHENNQSDHRAFLWNMWLLKKMKIME